MCDAEIQLASCTSSLKYLHQSTSDAGLQAVTLGDTWRCSPLPVMYRGDLCSVTVCHSSFVPLSGPQAGKSKAGVYPVMNGDRLTGDRWSQPDSECHRHPNLSYISQYGCPWMCANIQTHTAALLNTAGMWSQGQFWVELTTSETYSMTPWTTEVSI